MLKLVIEDDTGSKSVVPVIREEITIGRKEGNTIRLTERNVSRRHARIVRSNGDVYVEDVEARYGIKKNGQKIDDRAMFGEGDVVRIGDYRLTLQPETSSEVERARNTSAAAAELSGDLDEEPTQVTRMDEVQGQPSSASSSSTDSGASSGRPTKRLDVDPAKLVIISSNFAGQEFPLHQGETVVGRGEDCDIIIDHRSVSNTHAKLIREADQSYKVVDLNSKNGVRVGGDEYKSIHLQRGDIVQLGHVKMRFVAPGEEYTFTPQEDEVDGAADFDTSSGDGGLDPKVIVGGVLLLLALVGGGYAVLSGSGDGTADEPGSEDGAAAVAANETADEGSADSDGADEQKAESNPKVDKILTNAEENIKAGKLEKAVGALESAQELMEPTAKQSSDIDELLSTARTEQPFKRAYGAAKESVEDEEYAEALEKIDEIPDHSLFRDLIEEDGLVETSLDGLLEQAEKALDDDNKDEARKLAEQVLSYDSRDSEAEALLEKLEESDETAVASADTKDRAPGSGNARNNKPAPAQRNAGGGESKPEPKPDPKPKPEPKPQLSDAEAKSLFQQAAKSLFKGDHQGAINKCSKALRAGHKPCHRVLGLAHKNLGNTSKACQNFTTYLNTNPADAAGIQSKMDDLGCP